MKIKTERRNQMKLRKNFEATLANGYNGIVILKTDVFGTIKNKLIEAMLKEDAKFEENEESEKVYIDLTKLPNINGIYKCNIAYYFAQGKDKYGNIEPLEDEHYFVIEEAQLKEF